MMQKQVMTAFLFPNTFYLTAGRRQIQKVCFLLCVWTCSGPTVCKHTCFVEHVLLQVSRTIRLAFIQTNTFFSTKSRRDVECHRVQTLSYSVLKSKVIQMQPVDGA